MKPHFKKLKKLKACSEAISWAERFNTIEEVIDNCHRGDWLLWLAERLNVDNRKVTLTKGHCANTVRHLMKDERSLKAVDVAIAYGEGKAIDEELNDAFSVADDADAAYVADVAYAAANIARKKNQIETTEICRKYLRDEIINNWKLNNKNDDRR